MLVPPGSQDTTSQHEERQEYQPTGDDDSIQGHAQSNSDDKADSHPCQHRGSAFSGRGTGDQSDQQPEEEQRYADEAPLRLV